MLPNRGMPIAGLLLLLAVWPAICWIFLHGGCGNAIVANLGHAVLRSACVGWPRENHGAAGLASVVGYL